MIGVARLCDTNQKYNKKTDVFPQALAGEDDFRLKPRESLGDRDDQFRESDSNWPRQFRLLRASDTSLPAFPYFSVRFNHFLAHACAISCRYRQNGGQND